MYGYPSPSHHTPGGMYAPHTLPLLAWWEAVCATFLLFLAWWEDSMCHILPFLTMVGGQYVPHSLLSSPWWEDSMYHIPHFLTMVGGQYVPHSLLSHTP